MEGKRFAAPLGGLLLLLAAYPAVAQEFPDKLAINLGPTQIWNNDTQFSARSSTGIIGTTVDFQQDLNGEQHFGRPFINGYYRFTPKQRIDFSWIRLNRTGTRTLTRDISVGDTTFTVNTQVRSEIDTTFAKLGYTWSFFRSDNVELGLTGGLALPAYTVKLDGPLNSVKESVSAPVPTVGFRLNYTITPRWVLKYANDSMYFDGGDKFQGALDDKSVAVEWRAVKNVIFGLGTEQLTINAKVDNGSYRGGLSDRYRGIRVYTGIRF